MNYRECAEWLKNHDNILLLTHVRPDGDTLGSASALCSALRRCGKKAALYNNPDITPKYMKYISRYVDAGFAYDCVVAVDVAEKHMFPAGYNGEADACIDHHPSNSHYAHELLLRPEKASCGEAVLEVIKELCGNVTPEEASLLYMAVSTDCGCFRYANVTAETFAAASELASYGASVQALNFDLFRQVSRARIVLEGEMAGPFRPGAARVKGQPAGTGAAAPVAASPAQDTAEEALTGITVTHGTMNKIFNIYISFI